MGSRRQIPVRAGHPLSDVCAPISSLVYASPSSSGFYWPTHWQILSGPQEAKHVRSFSKLRSMKPQSLQLISPSITGPPTLLLPLWFNSLPGSGTILSWLTANIQSYTKGQGLNKLLQRSHALFSTAMQMTVMCSLSRGLFLFWPMEPPVVKPRRQVRPCQSESHQGVRSQRRSLVRSSYSFSLTT